MDPCPTPDGVTAVTGIAGPALRVTRCTPDDLAGCPVPPPNACSTAATAAPARADPRRSDGSHHRGRAAGRVGRARGLPLLAALHPAPPRRSPKIPRARGLDFMIAKAVAAIALAASTAGGIALATTSTPADPHAVATSEAAATDDATPSAVVVASPGPVAALGRPDEAADPPAARARTGSDSAGAASSHDAGGTADHPTGLCRASSNIADRRPRRQGRREPRLHRRRLRRRRCRHRRPDRPAERPPQHCPRQPGPPHRQAGHHRSREGRHRQQAGEGRQAGPRARARATARATPPGPGTGTTASRRGTAATADAHRLLGPRTGTRGKGPFRISGTGPFDSLPM